MIVFTLAYVLVSLCFVAPPREFVSAGLTVQNILSSYLGSEDMDFVGYHLKRTTSTLLIHSLLPLGKVFLKCYDVVLGNIQVVLGNILRIFFLAISNFCYFLRQKVFFQYIIYLSICKFPNRTNKIFHAAVSLCVVIKKPV